MAKNLYCFIIFAASLSNGLAVITCYDRFSKSSTDSGVSKVCTGSTCYSFYVVSATHVPPFYNSAGCGSCDINSWPSCTMCSTDLCNSVTPSNISCHHRSSVNIENGTIAPCATGFTSCYSKSEEYTTHYYAGCGGCNGKYKDCTSCNTSNCNTLTPSSLSCHHRWTESSTTIGTRSCATGITTCYSYTTSGWRTFAGCGSCQRVPQPESDCTTCSTDYCNTQTPSNISCYYRWQSVSNSNGTIQNCSTGISTCYSYGDALSSTAGCGVCNTSTSKSCVTCDSALCNSLTPSKIKCYYRKDYYSTSDGVMESCSTAVSTCYSYSSGWYSYAGCGVCNAGTTATYGCKTCSTDYCNRRTSETSATIKAASAAYTAPRASTVATPGITAAAAPTTSVSFSIKCYSRHAASIGTNGTVTTCPTGVSTCYSFISDTLQKSYAGCGTCSASSGSSCTICSADHCNAASFSCFRRSTLSSSYNGTVSACISGVSSCFSYTSGSLRHGGCGTCGLASPDADCTACSGHLCNHQAPPINCWSSFGDSKHSDRKKTTCSARSCYEYSYGSGSLFFAGCGDCPVSTRNSNCRTCSTEYCNSAAAAAAAAGLSVTCSILLVLLRVL